MTEEIEPQGFQVAFPTTQWSEILHSADADSEFRRRTLTNLITGYWRPIYCCVRFGWNLAPGESQRIVQSFFARLITLDVLKSLRPEQGRFRDFLRRKLREYMASDGQEISQPDLKVDPVVSLEGAESLTSTPGEPDQVFDREWMALLVERALEALQKEMVQDSKETAFHVFQIFDIRGDTRSQKEVAEQLNISTGEVYRHLWDTRKRLRKIMLRKISEYALDERDAREELRWILG